MVTLIERYLIEDIDAVRKQYSYIPEDEFDFLLSVDPTFNPESNSVGKYGKWLLGMYKKDDAYISDLLDCYRSGDKAEIEYTKKDIQDTIKTYDEYKNDRTKTIEKDIGKFKTFSDMVSAVEGVGEATLSKKQARRQAEKDKPYDMVFDGEKYAIFVPKNHEGDMVLASFGNSKKATWCTAADSENGQWRYDYYLADGGKYYVLINKKNYEDKYQFHFESNQFMNRYNEPIDIGDILEEDEDLKEFFEDEGYDVEKYYLRVPETDEEQVDMIEDWLDGYDYDWIEWIDGQTVFGAIDRIDGMDDIARDEADYFYDEEPEMQFNMLQSVGLMTEYGSFEEFKKENPDVEDFSDYKGEYEEKYKGIYDSVYAWANDTYGSWDKLDYRTKIDIVEQFDLTSWDVANYIVYGKGEGYEWCEDIVSQRRGNEW